MKTKKKRLKLKRQSGFFVQELQQNSENKMPDPEIGTQSNHAAFTANPPAPIKFYSDSDKGKVWKEWLQQYEWFTVSSGIDEFTKYRQAAILLNCLGSEIMPTFNGFNISDEDKKDPVKIIEKFTEAFTPTTNTTYNTYVFFNIAQKENDEQFDEFLSRLQVAARNCDFNKPAEGMTCEDRLLRDKIILGIRSDAVRRNLLADSKLTLEKAINHCRASESLTNQANAIISKKEPQCDFVRSPKVQLIRNSAKNVKVEAT